MTMTQAGLEAGFGPANDGVVADGRTDLMEVVSQLPAQRVLLSHLATGFLLREGGLDTAHVKLLADVAVPADIPPVLLQLRTMRIVDGMHRIAAAKLRGDDRISARLIDCTDDQAFIAALKSNTLHGLPLSRADRIAGARRILSTHPDWSDRAVAEAAGVSAPTIASIRHQAASDLSGPAKRLGRDGKRRPVAGVEGRLRAADLITARPDAPLREIAKAADVSIGTVHDVRERIRRGEDPLPRRHRRPLQSVDGTGDAERPSSPGRRDDTPPDIRGMSRQTVLARLANDPALRYSENGRAFLQWITLNATQPTEWPKFVDAIPAHWMRHISLLADGVSEQWRMLATELRTRQQSAS